MIAGSGQQAGVGETGTELAYVVGFIFDSDRHRVALIRKNRPPWQAGLLNGVGGKIESGESAAQAMARETREEAGYYIAPWQWKHFAELSGSNDGPGESFRLQVFAATEDLSRLETTEGEAIEIVHISKINWMRHEMVANLPWLIGLALDHLEDGRPAFAIVTYL